MDKKYIFPIIIILAFIIDLIVGRALYNAYHASGLIATDAGFGSFTTTSMFFSFFLSIPFYVIVLIFFREEKLLNIFSALSIIVAFCFAGYVSLSNYYIFDTIIIRLYASVSYFLGFFNIIIATSIILKELHTKTVTISLLYFSISQFVFGTLVVDHVRGYLVGLFGPGEENIANVFLVYDIFLILIRVSVIVLQVFAILSLLQVQSGKKKVFRTV